MALALVLGVLHAFTDAATVTVLLRATGVDELTPGVLFGWVLAYDLMAFGLQPVLGWVQDRWATPRTGMFVGLGLILASIGVLETAPLAAGTGAGAGPSTTAGLALTVALAAAGNAVFHLGAGAQVLRLGLDVAARAGVFVAPGALGLGLGLWFGKHPGSGPAWLVGVPVLVAVVVVAALRVPDRPSAVAASPGSSRWSPAGHSFGDLTAGLPMTSVASGALMLLMTSIGIRSLVGMSASRGYPSGSWLLVGIPLVAFAGKALGGFLADGYGWVRTTVTALLLSAPALAFTYPHPVVLLAGLLVFQMTMPVTLVAIVRLMPDRLATGFGLSCLALIVGGLPAMFPWGANLCSKPMLGAWILLSAFAAWAGLRVSGLTWRPRSVTDVADAVPSPSVTALAEVTRL